MKAVNLRIVSLEEDIGDMLLMYKDLITEK